MIENGIFDIVPRSQVPIIKRFFMPSGPTDTRQNQQEKSTAIGHAYVQMTVDKPKALTIMRHTHQ
eukprot:10584417-Ditylum_brightwellii.AAC.1